MYTCMYTQPVNHSTIRGQQSQRQLLLTPASHLTCSAMKRVEMRRVVTGARDEKKREGNRDTKMRKQKN